MTTRAPRQGKSKAIASRETVARPPSAHGNGQRTVQVEEVKATISTNEVLPLVPPTSQVTTGGHQVAPHDLDVLRGGWPALLELVELQAHVVQIPSFVPPKGRIIDYDLALLAFAERWMEEIAGGDSDRPYIDLRTFAYRVRKHPAKQCLMTLRGAILDARSKPHPLRDDWPEDDGDGLRWVLSRFRHHHRVGLVYMPEETDGDGRRLYVPSLSRAGLARALWISTAVLPAGVAPALTAIVSGIGLPLPT